MSRNIGLIALLLTVALPIRAQDTEALPSHQTHPATSSGGLVALAKPVARVNGAVLTQGDLLREMYAIFPYARQHNGTFPTALEPYIHQGALKMIEFEELAYQEAKRRQMRISPERLTQAEKQFRKQFGTEQEFRQFLQAENNNSDMVLREKIERSLLIEDLLQAEVTDKSQVSLAEVRSFYVKNLEKFKLPESYDLQTITIMPPVQASRQQPNPPAPTPEQAKEMRIRAEDALRQAKVTKSFEEFGLLAEKISEDDYRVMMGHHKNVDAKDLPPEVLQAAAKLQSGQISDLIQAEGAYTIIRLNAHTPARTQSFDEVSQALLDQMRQQKSERLRRELDANLRRSAKIEEL
jgi:peptidyl-prolyl cis-trans isomerase SurA